MTETVRRTDHDRRIKTYDRLQELKAKGISRKEIVDHLHNTSSIPKGTLYHWYAGDYAPWGRRERKTVEWKPELFYVLGALLGDGCTYNWKTQKNVILIAGNKDFASKYAERITACVEKEVKAYINRSKNIWRTEINNDELYSVLGRLRDDTDYLEELILDTDRAAALLFIEGFFDAEGCVKIINDAARNTPKICLDITNTIHAFLEVIRHLLKQHLDIESRYSNQDAHIKDGQKRKKVYHLRIYKKAYIKQFFHHISTTKLKEDKRPYVENWLGTTLSQPPRNYPLPDSS